MNSPRRAPSLLRERRLMRAGAGSVVGVDEVGRGALAGPVSVGAVLVLPDTGTAPAGVRDSKELPAAERERLAPRIRGWAPASAVGHADPVEIDTLGILAALRLAAVRALRQLGQSIGAVLLDGSHDWLGGGEGWLPEFPGASVSTRVKADRDCSAVAAASVLAKVARDGLMAELGDLHPAYRWQSNRGYAAPEHLAALAAAGPCRLHRLSWQLPGVALGELDRIDPSRLRTWRRFEQGEQLLLLPGAAADAQGPSAVHS